MWSTGYSVHGSCGPVRYRPRCLRGSGKGRFRAGHGVDTLLGPEGTGPSAPSGSLCREAGLPGGVGVFLLDHGTGSSSTRVGRDWWARLLFENCTVDASISETRDPHEEP
jgi:hypothetical protein